jgi:hypothetical protein
LEWKTTFFYQTKKNVLFTEKEISPSTTLRTGYEATGSIELGILEIVSSFFTHNDIFDIAE